MSSAVRPDPRRLTRIGAQLLLASLLSACAVEPEPVDRMTVDARVDADLAAILDAPPAQAVTLAEAIARSLKYNLDNRLKLMEVIVANDHLDLAQYDMLPRLALNAGYGYRDRRLASESRSILTDRQSLEPSTSQQQGLGTGDLETSWNILDFGVSYLAAKQAADQVLISVERQRKIVQNIVKDVRYAWYRMRSATRLTQELNLLLDDLTAARRDAQRIVDEGLRPRSDALGYLRDLLDLEREMLALRRDLEEARIELSALIGVAPGTEFALNDGATLRLRPEQLHGYLETVPMEELRTYALRSRPELIEEDYRTRIAEREVRKARLRMLPGIELYAGAHYNDNGFLVNQGWGLYGVRLTWNLLRAFSQPRAVRLAEDELRLAEVRRMALAMAVMTQVDVAALRFLSAAETHELALAISEVNDALAQQQARQVEARSGDALSSLRTRARAMVARLRLDTALADYQDAAGQLVVSLGQDPVPLFDHGADLPTLTAEIEDYLSGDTLPTHEDEDRVGALRALERRLDLDPFLAPRTDR